MKTKKSTRKYIKVLVPTLNDIVLLGQAIFCLMVGSTVVGALALALCMIVEILFKVKLIS